jgi:hypothetical protein
VTLKWCRISGTGNCASLHFRRGEGGDGNRIALIGASAACFVLVLCYECGFRGFVELLRQFNVCKLQIPLRRAQFESHSLRHHQEQSLPNQPALSIKQSSVISNRASRGRMRLGMPNSPDLSLRNRAYLDGSEIVA